MAITYTIYTWKWIDVLGVTKQFTIRTFRSIDDVRNVALSQFSDDLIARHVIIHEKPIIESDKVNI